MTYRMLARAAAVAALALLGACAPKTQAATCVPVAPSAVPVVLPSLLVPADGATGVPLPTVLVQVQLVAPGAQLRLTDANGGIVNGTSFSPTDTPGVSSATVPAPGTATALAAHTTYTVHVDYAIAQVSCLPPGANMPPVQITGFVIGSFTTQ